MKKAVHIDSRAIKQSVVGVTRKFSCAIAGCPKFDAWNIKISRVRDVRSVDRRDIFGRRAKDKEENNEHMT